MRPDALVLIDWGPCARRPLVGRALPDHARAIGAFQLVREIARGGMGVVHLAERVGPNGKRERVALKTLRPDLIRNPRAVDMFTRESRLLGSLRHANVVRAIDAGTEDSAPWLAMELLEGQTLAELTRNDLADALPLVAKLRIVCDVLSALHHVHTRTNELGLEAGIVHRDVSPQNVFITTDGRVKLLDFGVAKTYEHSAVTDRGVLKGRASYMAPEQVTGDTVDRRTDVFAVGVVLRELLLGARLWGGCEATEIIVRLARRELPSFPETAAVPRELRGICQKAMAPEIGQRFTSALAMRTCIERYVARRTMRNALEDVVPEVTRKVGAPPPSGPRLVMQQTRPAPMVLAERAPTRPTPAFVDTPTVRVLVAEIDSERRIASAQSERPVAQTVVPSTETTSFRLPLLGALVLALFTVLAATIARSAGSEPSASGTPNLAR